MTDYLNSGVALLREKAEGLGVLGVIGVALLVLSAAFTLGALEPLRADIASLSDRRAELQSLPVRSAPQSGAEKGRPTANSMDLPSAADALPQVMRLTDLAEQQGLKLKQGDYRLHRDRAAGVSAYQMHYPVSGSYVALRQFINDALNQFPALALEEVQIRRSTIGAPDVEARLRFTLYLRES